MWDDISLLARTFHLGQLPLAARASGRSGSADPSNLLQRIRTSLRGMPREQKMLKRHLPGVIYHQILVYEEQRIRSYSRIKYRSQKCIFTGQLRKCRVVTTVGRRAPRPRFFEGPSHSLPCLSHTMFSLISLRESSPPQNRESFVYYH